MAPITRSATNVLTRSAGVAKPKKAAAKATPKKAAAKAAKKEVKKAAKKEAKKETKKEKPAKEFDPRFLASDNDNTSSENERSMTDRLNTMSRAASFEGLVQAIDEYVDGATKAILKAKAVQL